MRPIVRVSLPDLRLAAMSLRRKPSFWIDWATLSAIAGSTEATWLTTRETVLRLTPASAATSTIVGRPRSVAMPVSSRIAVQL